MKCGPETTETLKQIQTPSAKYKLGSVIKYLDEKRKGILHYGEVVAIIIVKTGVEYQTQDHNRVSESKVEA